MIINYDAPGQLCNRIWSLLPSIAYGLEYKEKVTLINFDEYSEHFEHLNKNKLIRFTSHERLQRLFLSLKARGKIQNGRKSIFSNLLGLNLIEGWSNRLGNAEMVVNQSDEIRNIFQFKKEVTKEVDSFFASLTNVEVIGVHIRRGDYKEWLDGVYYYTDEEYVRVMKNIADELKGKGKKAIFLLCSNEKLDRKNFDAFDSFVIPNSSASKDLYGLSKCSYIVGPPSSYSQWASFLRKVPLKFILSKNEAIDLAQFSEIVAFNKFKNGNELNID